MSLKISLGFLINYLEFLYVFLQWRPMVLPDRYIDHGAQSDQIEEAGLSPKHIAGTVVSLIGGGKESLHFINNLNL